ncbi:MAG TPA: class I SAM-dependent methyltransferase [Planctomycetota bacterium]|jgi:SAM-dependent methyltransferase|nr:class I SAM-dependent methyltransferase [Planctomycetota bacterium]
MDRYGLPDSYATNLDADGQPLVYEDSPRNAATMQVAVYRHLARLIRRHNFKSVLDIGCGLGVKLDKYIAPLTTDITGVDGPHCVNHCRQTYLFGKWVTDDIECPVRRLDRTFDVILAADVIEHLLDPEKLIAYARELAHKDTVMLISTPDREKIYAPGTKPLNGPPENRTHVREWTGAELKGFLAKLDLEILDQRWVESKRPKGVLARVFGAQGPAQTQLITAKFKNLPA